MSKLLLFLTISLTGISVLHSIEQEDINRLRVIIREKINQYNVEHGTNYSLDRRNNDNGWYVIIQEKIEKYNIANGTSYSLSDVNHIKRTGLFAERVNTFSRFNPFILWMNGYVTGQYVKINERKTRYSTYADKETLEAHKRNFLHTAPQVTIQKSEQIEREKDQNGHTKEAQIKTEVLQQEGIKVEIDMTEYDKDLMSRRPWYQKPIPVLSLAVPATFVGTWIF